MSELGFILFYLELLELVRDILPHLKMVLILMFLERRDAFFDSVSEHCLGVEDFVPFEQIWLFLQGGLVLL